MKQAVIYVPGVAQHLFGQSAEVVAVRLAQALRKHDPALRDVRVTVVKGALDLGATRADCVQVEALVGEAWRELVDVYEVNYLEAFVGRFMARTPFERALSALIVFGGQLKQMRTIFSKESKCFRDNLQGFLMLGLILLLAGYLVYWIFLAVAGFFAFDVFTTGTAFAMDAAKATKTATTLAIAALVLTLVRYAFTTLLGKLERTAVELFAVCKYIKSDARFQDCLEPIRQAAVALRRKGYERVDTVSFSLGCLITGDAFFPRQDTLRRTTDPIDRWVTIGFPYDLVRSAYPAYFDNRRQAVAFERWWNVTEHADFLGSNFRMDTETCDPDPTVGFGHDGGCTGPGRNIYYEPPPGGERHQRLKQRSAADWIPLRRLQNHGVYWNPNDALARSCFTVLVAEGFFDTTPPRQPTRVTAKARAKPVRQAGRATALA